MVALTSKSALKASYYRIGARYYDSDIGGWVSVDPMRQFANPYLYTGNGANPLNGVDPDGNQIGNIAFAIEQNAPTIGNFISRLNPLLYNQMYGVSFNVATNPTVVTGLKITEDVISTKFDPNPPALSKTGLTVFAFENLSTLCNAWYALFGAMINPFNPNYWEENFWKEIDKSMDNAQMGSDFNLELQIKPDISEPDVTATK